MTPVREAVASFYLYPNYQNSGPRVVLLVESRWTQFLKNRVGLPVAPFYSRPRRACEPDLHANGHPWAWLYLPEDAVKDEARWSKEGDLEEFKAAMEQAIAAAQEAKIHEAEAAERSGVVMGEWAA